MFYHSITKYSTSVSIIFQQNAEHIRATAVIDPSQSDPQTEAATKSITDDLQSQTELEQLSSISTATTADGTTVQTENQGTF